MLAISRADRRPDLLLLAPAFLTEDGVHRRSESAKILPRQSFLRCPEEPADAVEFARVEGRAVVASFDGGRITSDPGALLLGAADRVIGLRCKLAARFTDMHNPAFIEHDFETLVMRRVAAIAAGYEDLMDHDELRHDPVLATLPGKLTAAAVTAHHWPNFDTRSWLLGAFCVRVGCMWLKLLVSSADCQRNGDDSD
jgi:hypothetical protein